MGDLNAELDSSDVLFGHVMRKRCDGDRKCNIEKFMDFCNLLRLIIGRTLVKHRTCPKVSCLSTERQCMKIGLTTSRSMVDLKMIFFICVRRWAMGNFLVVTCGFLQNWTTSTPLPPFAERTRQTVNNPHENLISTWPPLKVSSSLVRNKDELINVTNYDFAWRAFKVRYAFMMMITCRGGRCTSLWLRIV